MPTKLFSMNEAAKKLWPPVLSKSNPGLVVQASAAVTRATRPESVRTVSMATLRKSPRPRRLRSVSLMRAESMGIPGRNSNSDRITDSRVPKCN